MISAYFNNLQIGGQFREAVIGADHLSDDLQACLSDFIVGAVEGVKVDVLNAFLEDLHAIGCDFVVRDVQLLETTVFAEAFAEINETLIVDAGVGDVEVGKVAFITAD
jgi:hypothetical protein